MQAAVWTQERRHPAGHPNCGWLSLLDAPLGHLDGNLFRVFPCRNSRPIPGWRLVNFCNSVTKDLGEYLDSEGRRILTQMPESQNRAEQRSPAWGGALTGKIRHLTRKPKPYSYPRVRGRPYSPSPRTIRRAIPGVTRQLGQRSRCATGACRQIGSRRDRND
jgi:hypothetical protein